MEITLFWIFLALLSTLSAAEWPNFENIKSKTSIKDQEIAVKDLILRLLPHRADEFSVIVDPSIAKPGQDAFILETVDKKLVVTGTTGVAAAWAFHHFLKYFCNAHISWMGNQLDTIPKLLPAVKKSKIVVPHRFRYYQNVCTSSYSFVWWNWTRWQQEIDWMAMNGINLPLAFTAQEAIWQRLYLNLGLTQAELDVHFAGPAFLAWSRMGNINGWGGPLPNSSWYQTRLALQHKILQRMRSFGMIPVLPSFAGHIPKALMRIFPNASISTLSHWGHFSSPYVPTYLLDPGDPLFKQIGKAFIEEQILEYNGTDHIYNGDTFNEMQPKTSSPTYLAQASKSVYEAMSSADEKAVWLMQGWLFYSDPGFWQPAQVKAYLQGVPNGKMIVLDLYAEVSPMWNKTNSFYGQPFIWCMLHNFGGNIGMHGTLQAIATEPVKALSAKNSMVGIGIAPEGIETNYVVYDLMLEMGRRNETVDTESWLKEYTKRRYGSENSNVDIAWEALRTSVYNDVEGAGRHCRAAVVMKPSFHLQPDIWYEPGLVSKAWNAMLKASAQLIGAETFEYDLVDITRQVLQLLSNDYYKDLISSYQSKDKSGLTEAAFNFFTIVGNMEFVLQGNEYFLLGRWLNAAKRMAKTPAEEKLFEFNARNQITMWGPRENIEDYANKMWSGMVGSFYNVRWQMFVQDLKESLAQGKPFNQTQFNEEILKFETDWNAKQSEEYPEHPERDILEKIISIHKKYSDILAKLF